MNNAKQKELIELLKAEKRALQRKINSLDETISLFEITVDKEILTEIDDGYDKNASLKNKINFFFKKESRFLHNRELAELANEREPNISVKDFIRKFSQHLSQLKKDGKLTKYVVNKQNNNTFWGSPKWLDSNNEIIEQYKYKDKYVKKTGSKDLFDL
ncbi:MAG: hypothetical protein V3V16_02855 [Melioribacteraceae bacterium]